MKGDALTNVDVADLVSYESYRLRTAAIIDRHGRRFLVRGGDEAPHAFYRSPEYLKILPFRTAHGAVTLAIAVGVGQAASSDGAGL